MLRVVSLTLALVAGVRARSLDFDCPRSYELSANKTTRSAGCACDVTMQMYACPSTGLYTPVSVDIQCNNHASPQTAKPQHTEVSTAAGLDLTQCALPTALAGLSPVEGVLFELSITLDGVRGELRREHLQGLPGVERLIMTNAADQSSIPFDTLNALPALKEYRIDCANLTLEARGEDDLPHPTLLAVALINSGVADVPSGAFKRIGNVKVLDLSRNKITNFTNDAFKGLKNLTTLSLAGNPIKALPSLAFEFTPHLRRLHLDETHLAAVPGDAFVGLQNLKEITFKNGKRTIEFGARALSLLPALKELIIQSTPLKPLPSDLLLYSTALEELKITDAGLELIPKGFLSTQQRLRKLDLSGNKIKVLEDNFFYFITALNELNLDRNYIKKFPNNIFAGLTKLKSLSANDNRLNHIGDTAFPLTNSIELLSFNNNRLVWESFQLEHDMLDFKWNLSELKELHLQGNNIAIVIPVWKKYQKLQKLDLSRNNFTMLSESDVLFQAQDLVIDFRHNHITNVAFLNNDEDLARRSTTHVLLDGNPFHCDCLLYKFVQRLHWSKQFVSPLKLDPVFSQCASPPSLKGRLIRNLPLPSLTCSLAPQDCPDNCSCFIRPATRSLELDCKAEPFKYPNPKNYDQQTSQLRLRSIQSLALPSHVVSLNLTGLGLEKAPSLKLLKNLQHLDLSQNYLVNAPTELFQANISLRLAGNPFACDCSHLDNVNALLNNLAHFDADNVTCSGGKPLMSIDIDKLCEVQKAALLGGCLAAVGLVVAIAAGFAYRYNLEIKVCLFSFGWYQSWMPEDDSDINAQYDAFVSFSQEDAKWVAEELLPKLEGEPNNYKLCVHYRDWVVGDMIPAQIATSVEQSRRTIVVLTESFLKSTWALLEFRAANVRAQRERRTRVLVIVLEEKIPHCDEMDAELRAYLTTNTYLKWRDPWFWEKLKYAMPHKSSRNK